MIRDGYPRRLQAEKERADLVERWRTYPDAVQSLLAALLHIHGLQAAQLATQALEECLRPQSVQQKEERTDATPLD